VIQVAQVAQVTQVPQAMAGELSLQVMHGPLA